MDAFFSPAWGNAWAGMVPIALSGIIVMVRWPGAGKRLSDMSWYGPGEKRLAGCLSLVFLFIGALSLGVSLSREPLFLVPGTVLYLLSMGFLAASYRAYVYTPKGRVVCSGPYRRSRNPIYLFVITAMLSLALASASLVLAVPMAAYALVQHRLVLREEAYCLGRYGSEFKKYMDRIPRYLGRGAR